MNVFFKSFIAGICVIVLGVNLSYGMGKTSCCKKKGAEPGQLLILQETQAQRKERLAGEQGALAAKQREKDLTITGKPVSVKSLKINPLDILPPLTTVIFVDDSNFNAIALEGFIFGNKLSRNFHHYGDGLNFLAFLDKDKPDFDAVKAAEIASADAIFMDFSMPIMNGDEVIQNFLRLNLVAANGKKPVIIGYSNCGTNNDTMKRVGSQYSITKPITSPIPELARQISDHINAAIDERPYPAPVPSTDRKISDEIKLVELERMTIKVHTIGNLDAAQEDVIEHLSQRFQMLDSHGHEINDSVRNSCAGSVGSIVIP